MSLKTGHGIYCSTLRLSPEPSCIIYFRGFNCNLQGYLLDSKKVRICFDFVRLQNQKHRNKARTLLKKLW